MREQPLTPFVTTPVTVQQQARSPETRSIGKPLRLTLQLQPLRATFSTNRSQLTSTALTVAPGLPPASGLLLTVVLLIPSRQVRGLLPSPRLTTLATAPRRLL